MFFIRKDSIIRNFKKHQKEMFINCLDSVSKSKMSNNVYWLEKKSFQNPSVNSLGEVQFFDGTYVSLPEPLYIEGNQRPVIFRR